MIISGFICSFSSCTKKGSIVCINMASYLFLIGDLLPEWISVYCNPSFLKQIKCFWNVCVKIVVFVWNLFEGRLHKPAYWFYCFNFFARKLGTVLCKCLELPPNFFIFCSQETFLLYIFSFNCSWTIILQASWVAFSSFYLDVACSFPQFESSLCTKPSSENFCV